MSYFELFFWLIMSQFTSFSSARIVPSSYADLDGDIQFIEHILARLDNLLGRHAARERAEGGGARQARAVRAGQPLALAQIICGGFAARCT
jgi:hypothetical protein